MTKQVPWNRIILEEFINLSTLTKDEEDVIRTHAAGWSRKEQSIKLGMSISKIDMIIHGLKLKYDSVQPYSKVLPVRKPNRTFLH